MRRNLRREIRLLRVHAAVSSLLLIVITTAAFRQGSRDAKFDELTVGRLNVVDANGTLRMVLSNQDRMHPGVIDGRTIVRERPVAGLLFFNEAGDEVGGLTFTGRDMNGSPRANAGIMFDQYKQDQTIGITYSEGAGRRTAALQVWDRPDSSLGELVDKLNAANRIADAAEREKAVAAIRAAAPPAPRRLFAGKMPDRSSTVALSDANGKVRLAMTVDADGNPRIEFMDEAGKVISRLPSK